LIDDRLFVRFEEVEMASYTTRVELHVGEDEEDLS
jgi:hypothetical protein